MKARPKQHCGDRFPQTEWSVVQRAGELCDRAAHAALSAAYWYPVYCYLRSQGANQDEARDLTQGVFLMLSERNCLAKVDAERGRFRTWLRAVAKNYFSKVRARARAQKHGGRTVMLSLDTQAAEEQLAHLCRAELTPEQLFDRCWAQTVVRRAISKLRAQLAADGELAPSSELLEGLLSGERARYQDPAQVGARSSGAMRVRRHRVKARLAQRFGQVLRDEIASMVDRAAIDDEIEMLLDALS